MKKSGLLLLFVFFQISFSQNLKSIDSLKVVVRKTTNDSLKIEILNKLFFIEVYSDLNASKKYYQQVFSIAGSTKNNFAYAKGYNLKGVYYDFSGKLDSAKYCYNQAILFSHKSKAISVEGSAYNNLGLIDWNEGRFYNALLNYNKALKVFEKINNKQYQANVLSNIGLIYDDIDDDEKAIQYIQTSMKIKKEIKDNYGLSISYINLGKIQEKKSNYKQAIVNYKKAISIKRKINDQLGIAIGNHNMASALMKIYRKDEAIQLLTEAEEICKKSDAASNILENIYLEFTDIYIELRNNLKAKQYNQKLLEMTQKTNDLERLSNYYENESQIAKLDNNYKRAYDFHFKYDSIKEITNSVSLKKSINLIEAKYQSEKKEKELLKTKNQLFVKKIENKRKNTWLLISSIVILSISLIGFLIYRQQKLKNKQQSQEFVLKEAISKIETQNQLQEQRLSISRDLHDNIGAQLTFIISSVDNLKFGNKNFEDKVTNQLSKISNFTKSTIVELRDTIWAMNSNEFYFEDLRSRIYNFIEKAQTAAENIVFKFTIDKDLKDLKLTAIAGINIYRTIQEAINNAIKHANATEILVDVKNINDKINVTIKDNGTGFDMDTSKFGNGLHNMKKRIEEIGDEFEISSLVNKGTLVNFTINK